jgi:hypothetical protein
MKKMKSPNCLNLKLSIILLSAAFVNCGELPTNLAIQGEQQTDSELADAEQSFALDNNDFNTYEQNGEIPDAIKLIREQQKLLRQATAECAGFSEEVKSFEGEKKALISNAESKESIRENLKALHEKFRTEVLDTNRERLRECHQEMKESEDGKKLRDIIHACFTRPEKDSMRGEQRRANLKGVFGSKKRRGHGPRFGRLPPKEMADFESDTCKAAISNKTDLTDNTVEEASDDLDAEEAE